jgi:hypothetical protein
MYTQTDLLVQHDFRIPGTKTQRANVNVNVTNLFDQMTVFDENHAPYRDSFVPPGLSTAGTNTQLAPADQYFFNGFDVKALAAQMRAAGATMRDNPLYLHPTSFQGRRGVRLAVKWSF